MPGIDVLGGLGRSRIDRLKRMGIKTTLDLLKKGALPADRAAITKELDMEPSALMEWIIYCDFFRIKGMKAEYIHLLQKSGIGTVQELAFYDAGLLSERLQEAGNNRIQLPSRKILQDWIREAVNLLPIIWFDGMFCQGLGN